MSFQQSETVIVDVQFVAGNNYQLFAKELVILDCDSIIPLYYLFKPPYSVHELNDRAKRHCEFVCDNINNLRWDDGYIAYNDIKIILQQISNKTIIVKGEQKMVWLQKFLKDSTIVNLDTTVGLNSLKSYRHSCPTHKADYKRCAVNNVFKLLVFMEKTNQFNDINTCTSMNYVNNESQTGCK